MTPEEIRNIFSGARNALNAGKITKEEHDTILRHYYGTTDEQEAIDKHADSHHEKTIAITMGLLLLLSIGLFWDGGITGMAIFNDANQPLTNITSITVTGTMYGDGNATIWLDTTNGPLLVGTIHSDTGQPMTDKPSYTQGETITVLYTPENATYYFDDGTTSMPVDLPFNATANGTLLIVTTTDTYRLPIIIGDMPRTTAFTGLCTDTCALEPTDGTLRIETVGTTVNITSIQAGTPNNAPAQSAPFDARTVDETMTIDLSEHFTDPDGDALFYSTSTSSIAQLTVEDSTLTITPQSDGAENITIYASDLQEMVSGMMEITILLPTAVNETNMTENATQGNETNVTAGAPPIIDVNTTVPNTTPDVTSDINTTNATNTTNITAACDDPDPNKRPLDCLNMDAAKFFEEDIFLEDESRTQVARITPIGNLLITGKVVKQSTATAPAGAFTIGYKDEDFNYIPTAWIDEQGNLHLRGTLHEENANLVPPPGSYAVINRRGIYMAYADTRTGDLYVRGNVIPYRGSIYE